MGLRFDYSKNKDYNVGSWFYSDMISRGMIENVRNSPYEKYVEGRTRAGIQMELITHHFGSWFPEDTKMYKGGHIADIGLITIANPNDWWSEITRNIFFFHEYLWKYVKIGLRRMLIM